MGKKLFGKFVRSAAFMTLALGIAGGIGVINAKAETLGDYTVTGGTKGTDYSYNSSNNVLTVNSSKAITVGADITTSKNGHIYITGTQDVNLTISSLKIVHMEYSIKEAPIQIDDNYKGTVTITVLGTDNRISSAGTPAILKNGTAGKLIINGSGSLQADASGYGITDTAWPAVIGGDAGKGTGNIQIDNSKLTIHSYSGGACIGGGSSSTIGTGGSASNIVINGGTIVAAIAPFLTTKGKETDRTNFFATNIGAAIGAGGNGDADGIYIKGGTVTATVTSRLGTDIAGAAIGGGCNGAGKNIVIDGGSVTAKVNNNTCGCAIGSGLRDVSATSFTNDTSVTISGGYVNASGFERSAGIGGYGSGFLADNATVNITGGTVYATGGQYAPGIGGGRYSNAKVYISGGSVIATGGNSSKNAIGLENDSIERNTKGTGEYIASLQRSADDAVDVALQTATDSNLANSLVEVSITDASGNAVAANYYGIKDMKADKNGKVYVYLPTGYTLKGISKGKDTTPKDPEKITPNMSSVKWVYIQNGTSVDYIAGTTKLSSNGLTYELNVTGLPEGVTVEKYVTVKNETGFENTQIDNAQKEAAIYKTTAYFAVNDADKYNVPDPMEVVWTLEKSDIKTTDDGKQVEVIKESNGGSGGTVAYSGDNNTSTTTVKVPDTVKIDGKKYQVTEVKAGAFANNKKLKKITIGKYVTKIGDKAFYKCTNLTSIVIPSKVTKIGKNAFYGCKKLKKITIKSKKLKSVGNNAIKGIHKKATIKCPSKKLAKQYKKKLFKSKTGYKKTMKIQ